MNASSSLFRIDRFAVPSPALQEFMARVRRIDALLSAQPGCRQHLVLTQAEGGGTVVHVITLVEWEDARAMENARDLVQAQYARESFDPPAFMQRLGVRAELAVYRMAEP
jgi:heme-degrading monooxygenase HmoA